MGATVQKRQILDPLSLHNVLNGIFKAFQTLCHIKTFQMICRPKQTVIFEYSLSSKIQIVNCVFAGKKYRRANKIGKQKEVDFSDGCQQRTKTLKKGVNSFIIENFIFSFFRKMSHVSYLSAFIISAVAVLPLGSRRFN